MRVDTSKWHACLQGRKSIQNYGRIHAFELAATCLSALLVTLSLVLPSFASGVSNNQTDVPSAIAQSDDGSVSSQDPSSSEKLAGGASHDESSSASVGESPSTSDGSSSGDAASAAAKAAPAPENAGSDSKVSSSDDFKSLANGGSYQLANDVTVSDTVWIAVDTSLDLNGHTINYTGNESLFHVQSGGTLTITDSQSPDNTKTEASGSDSVTGKEASIKYDAGKPTQLTYYVTESAPLGDRTGTTETLFEHTVTPKGVITATNSDGANSVIHMDGGTLNIAGGTICMPNSAKHGSDVHIIDAAGGTFNLSGGYIAGGQRTGNWGGGVCLSNRDTTLNMTGGVICANKGASGAGIYAAPGTKVNVSNGVISGNTVVEGEYGWSEAAGPGYGGGIYAVGATVNISGGYITNNSVLAHYNKRGQGLIGGGGIAVVSSGNDKNDGSFSMSGGYVTGNSSKEAGGGIYAGRYNIGLGDGNCNFTGGTIASNVAEDSEGGGIRVSAGTYAIISVNSANHAYITNNKCNSKNDWGGGGVFVQKDGKLNVKNALVTSNTSGGYGGGVAACPTGQTVVTHTSGAAIYSNTDDNKNFATNNGYGKVQDSSVAAQDEAFTSNGHADYFLVKDPGNTPVTVVTGRMLGGGAANWSGSVDGKAVTIDPNSGVDGKYLVGLTANPEPSAKKAAVGAATLTISGNYAYNHGGGIMTNGGLILGEVNNIDIYPGLNLKAIKALMQDGENAAAQLKSGAYTFVLLSPSSSNSGAPSWNDDGSLNYGGCLESARITNDKNGNLQFTANSEYSQSGTYLYYVAELPNNDGNTINFDKTIYKISASVAEEESKRTSLLGITFKHYTVSKLEVTPVVNGKEGQTYVPNISTSDNMVSFTLTKDGDSAAAFTNELAPYTTTGSFTPKVKKLVDGGDMKTFTFELFTKDSSGKETRVETATNDSSGNVTFAALSKKAGVTADASTGRVALTGGKGGTTNDTYYVREKNDGKTGYTYDTAVYKVSVTWQDDGNGHLTPTETYKKLDSNGNETSEAENDPTFNNKYAITLPSAGQAGITIAYIAGAAVLAYGVWRLVKARGKSRRGGE